MFSGGLESPMRKKLLNFSIFSLFQLNSILRGYIHRLLSPLPHLSHGQTVSGCDVSYGSDYNKSFHSHDD